MTINQKMLALGALAVVGLLTFGCSNRQEANTRENSDLWLTQYDSALAKAKAENKIVLMDFSGSDWCGWCKKLDREIFSTSEFADYADRKLVLLKVDFPKKARLSVEQEEHNQALAQKYNIEGFPTVILLDSSENMIGTLGYMEGGPKAFIAELERRIS